MTFLSKKPPRKEFPIWVTVRNISRRPSPSPRVCTDVHSVGRSYADVITKFSRLDGLPIFLTNGASLARFARLSSAKTVYSTKIVDFWRAANSVKKQGMSNFISLNVVKFCVIRTTNKNGSAEVVFVPKSARFLQLRVDSTFFLQLPVSKSNVIMIKYVLEENARMI